MLACPSQVRGLLFKLQAIFDLPKRLHTALEQGAVEIAVDAFAEAAPLLKRYGHKVIPYFFSHAVRVYYIDAKEHPGLDLD